MLGIAARSELDGDLPRKRSRLPAAILDRVGDVIEFPRGPDLIAELIEQLQKSGNAKCPLSDLNTSPEAWRKAARDAGRQLGRPVETVLGGTHVYATLRDWPADPEEEVIYRATLRAAVRGAANRVDDPEAG